MARKDSAMFNAYWNAVTQRGNFREITTSDMLQLLSDASYVITPAEANNYITSQRQNVKIIAEGKHGFHLYRFTR
ncbi:hypothetical protein [Erwinia aphidicola]|uniref:hypothetical protein n=1 Tax=Erwinia aphidicola TaxID=68334 RepID=UPI00301702B3